MLTQQRLIQKLKYDPATGIFRWRKGKKAGQIAGTVHDERGFRKVSIDGERHFLQRLAFLYMTGFMPNSNIEHIDGDPGNNCWSNLRVGERAQKAGHSAPHPIATPYKGVYRVGDLYAATVNRGEIRFNLGLFKTPEMAREEIRGYILRQQEQARIRQLYAA